MREIVSKSLTLRGFIYSEFAEQHYAEFLREVGAGIADGRTRYREDIVDGLEKALEAFIGMVDGGNFAKVIVRVGMLPDDVRHERALCDRKVEAFGRDCDDLTAAGRTTHRPRDGARHLRLRLVRSVSTNWVDCYPSRRRAQLPRAASGRSVASNARAAFKGCGWALPGMRNPKSTAPKSRLLAHAIITISSISARER
jgi:NAD(P)-dependent dehydrogenase (short-subunit alcohol dehydrogenase family)